jgi:hypothetical protein
MNDQEQQSPARTTGADTIFRALAQSVVRQSLAAANRSGANGKAPAEAAKAAQVIFARLWSMYPEFESIYSVLFTQHVGSEHAADVLNELQRAPMQRYLRARRRMAAELAEELQQLKRRMAAAAA